MTIYVENLPALMTGDELRALFSGYGAVGSVNLMRDPATGKPTGIGYVEMPDAREASEAVSALDGYGTGGRTLAVHELRAKSDISGPSADDVL